MRRPLSFVYLVLANIFIALVSSVVVTVIVFPLLLLQLLLFDILLLFPFQAKSEGLCGSISTAGSDMDIWCPYCHGCWAGLSISIYRS